MERGFLIGIAIFLALISLCHSAPVEEENDAGVVKRKPLLEKLGMELYRDPHYNPYKRRCYCGYGYPQWKMPPMGPWGPPMAPRPWGPPSVGHRPAPRPKGNSSSDEEEV